MPDTVRGGAYLQSDGKTWKNAEGRVLDPKNKDDKATLDEAREILDARQRDLANREANLAAALAQRDPAARAFATLLADRQPAKKAKADDDAIME